MALNKLKKWIGTQAMTAFFDQLNDNVDATNAAIDLVETNSASLQNQIRSRLDWKLVPGGGIGIGGNKTITTDTPFTEIMLIGSLANSVLYYRAVQERSASSLIEKNSTSPSGSVLKTGCQITGDSKAYIVCLSGSAEGVTAIFYR